MTFDDATLMAYADGELGPIEHKRVAQALVADPALADRVTAMALLGSRVRDAFAPIAHAPVSDGLSAMLAGNIVAIRPKPARQPWLTGLAAAAALVLGVGLGTQVPGLGLGLGGGMQKQPLVAIRDGALAAAGPLAHALDTQLASTAGDVRVPVSFRSAQGYCRVFASPAADGIACRSGDAWQLRQTRSGSTAPGSAYRQAASTDAELMRAAQDMMVGAPLDSATEQRARDARWR